MKKQKSLLATGRDMTKGLTKEMLLEAAEAWKNREYITPPRIFLRNGSEISFEPLKNARIVWNSDKQKFEPNEDSWKKKLELRS